MVSSPLHWIEKVCSMKVTLRDTEDKVLLHYSEKNGKVVYSFDNDESTLADEVISYLDELQRFRIPKSDEIDDFRVDIAKPTDNLTYFELALCNLYSETGIWVDW